jgi:hypothetical protein
MNPQGNNVNARCPGSKSVKISVISVYQWQSFFFAVGSLATLEDGKHWLSAKG